MDPNKNLEKELLALTHSLLKEAGSSHVERKISLQSSLQHHLGLDSLGRAELFNRIEKKWKIELPDQLLAEAESLEDILKAITAAKPALAATKQKSPTERYQKREASSFSKISKASTLLEVLFRHAEKTPEQPYIYLQTETGDEEILTYEQLLSNAQKVASAFRERGLKDGETVAIMLPTQLNFFYVFFGVLLASGIPVPIYPPLRPQQLERYAIQEARILANAEIRFLVTFQQAETLSRLLKSFVPSLQAVLNVEDLLKENTLKLSPPTLAGDDIALIQYTSGSTSTPKGVVLTHQNLLANIRSFGQAVEVTPQDIAVSWLPLYHDFGLIGLVLGSLYFGLPLILMSPITFLSRPEKWLWTIHYHRATISAAPNFAYEFCVRKIEDTALEGLDLSSWRIAANGAETIYPKTYERFVKKFKPYGFNPKAFLPVYGLAESTVGLTISLPNQLPRIDVLDRIALEEEKRAIPVSKSSGSAEIEIISCGKPLPQHKIRIVDNDNEEMPERFVGHLQFQGPSAMQGYYNNPEATKAAERDGWWDTGDFAYLADGEVFITGREKDLIIKAGRNIYPTVIEEQISEIPGIRRGCAVAFSVGDPEKGTEKVIIVAETAERNHKKRKLMKKRITEMLINTLDLNPDHIILVPPRTVPKTSSGKLQRSACKLMHQAGKLKTAPVWQQIINIGSQSLWMQTKSKLKLLLKLFYSLYIFLIIGFSALPFWLLIKILPTHIAGLVNQKAAWLLRMLSGCPLRVEGREHLYSNKSLIYVANHSSYIDSIVLTSVLPPTIRFVAKKELFPLPLLRDLLKKMKHIPVDRLDLSKGVEQTKILAKALQEGGSLLIFPEGTFSYAAGLRPFKLGAFKIAAETKTALCPIAIQGTRQILRGNSFLLRPGKIKLIIGEPIQPQGDEWEDIMRLKNEVRDFISTHCGELSLDFKG